LIIINFLIINKTVSFRGNAAQF